MEQLTDQGFKYFMCCMQTGMGNLHAKNQPSLYDDNRENVNLDINDRQTYKIDAYLNLIHLSNIEAEKIMFYTDGQLE